MEKIINTYEATAADGSSVTVYEVQELDNAGTMATPKRFAALPGKTLERHILENFRLGAIIAAA